MVKALSLASFGYNETFEKLLHEWKCEVEVNVLTAANKARGMLYFMKRSCSCLAKEAIVPLFIALMRPHVECVIQANCSYLGSDICHLERIQRATKGWLKCVRGLLLKRDSKPQNYRPSKKWIRKDLVLTHEILNNQIDCSSSPEGQD